MTDTQEPLELENVESSSVEESTTEVKPDQQETDLSGSSPDTEEQVVSEGEQPEEPTEPQIDPQQLESLKQERDRLMTDIRELRQQRRDAREVEKGDSLVVPQRPSESPDLSEFDPQDVESFKRLGKSLGYVQASELESKLFAEIQKATVDEFIETHPEYSVANDSDDRRWTALQQEVLLYRQPRDRKEIKAILERAHRAVSSRYEAPAPQAPSPTARPSLQMAQHGSRAGGSSQTALPSRRSSSPRSDLLPYLHGFSDEEKKEIEQKL
mgnify:CR=1 FL=1